MFCKFLFDDLNIEYIYILNLKIQYLIIFTRLFDFHKFNSLCFTRGTPKHYLINIFLGDWDLG